MTTPMLPPEGDDTLYPEDEAAARFLGRCPKTLERARKAGKAPPHIRISRGIFYRGQAIRNHLLQLEGEAANG